MKATGEKLQSVLALNGALAFSMCRTYETYGIFMYFPMKIRCGTGSRCLESRGTDVSSLEQLIEETALNLPDATDSIARQRLMKATEMLAGMCSCMALELHMASYYSY